MALYKVTSSVRRNLSKKTLQTAHRHVVLPTNTHIRLALKVADDSLAFSTLATRVLPVAADMR